MTRAQRIKRARERRARKRKHLAAARKFFTVARKVIHKTKREINVINKRIDHLKVDSGDKRKRALRWAHDNLFETESPAGSNSGPKITAWQRIIGYGFPVPWCGVYCYMALRAAGVEGISIRQGAVSYIEDDAKAKRGPFKGWSYSEADAEPGDLAVIGGRGVHVELVRYVKGGIVYTYGGNTSAGSSGSQSNGGGSFPRARGFGEVYGIAKVDYS